ncbi:aryl hydrocarbon receptor 1a [Triplophysa rosa]|uniref:Aryl hydrocarbon receptor n=1 Tax=Triplophysa rosa TaxID=992332 RepID=A0A9W7WQ53_TRIRA|nr:aryl hydrocarbon receptor 1a [Triplophysa rosa]KAI7806283.1 aryl hydrocarbon receptor 1 [Triplophysa rosa]
MSSTNVYASRKRRKPVPKSVQQPPSESVKTNPSKRHRDRLNGELERLANELPFPQEVISKLDKLTVLRLSVSYLRAKSHFNVTLNSKSSSQPTNNTKVQELPEGELLLQVINGFVLAVTSSGTIFYTSSTVADYLGFHQSDLIHQSVYELVHTEDRAEFQKQLHWALNPSCTPDAGQLVQVSHDAPLPQMHYSPEQLPPENSTFLERNFVCRLRCLLDSSSGFLAVNFQGRMKFLYGQSEKTADGKPIPSQLALFALVCPVRPPSILEIGFKSFMFRTKHKLDFTPTACDAKGEIVLGYTEAELCYRGSGYQFIHAADMLYCAENHMRMMKTGESGLTVFRLLTKYNHWLWVQANARLIYKNGQPDCIIASQRAITDEEGEENLRKRTMMLPFSFTTGEAVLYETNLPRSLSNNTPSDPRAPGDTDRPKTLDPDSLLGSMLRQDESIYVCPAGSDKTLPSIHCIGTNDLCGISPSVLSPSESSLFRRQPIMRSGGDDSCDILSFMGSLGISPDDLKLLQQDKLFLSIDLDGGNNTADLTDRVLSYVQHSLRNKTDRTLSSDVRGNLNPTLQKAPLFSSEDQRLYSISDSHTISQEQQMSFIMDTQGIQEHQNNPHASHPYDGTEVTQCQLSHITVQKQQVRIMNQQCHTALMDNQQLPNLPPLQVRNAFGNAQVCKNIPHVPDSDSQQVPPLFQPELQQSGCFYLETSPLEMKNSYRNHLNTVSISCSQELSSPYITAGDADVSAFTAQDLEELLSSLDEGGMDRNGQLGQNVGMGIRAECSATHLAQHQNNRPHPNLSLGGYL